MSLKSTAPPTDRYSSIREPTMVGQSALRLIKESPPTVVGMGDLGSRIDGELVTHALGSCIAVVLVDRANHASALLHFMLPESRIDPGRAATSPMMFADLGIPAAIQAVFRLGAQPKRTEARLVGGASVPGGPSGFEIGKRNILAARKLLWQAGIPITSQEVGGEIARTVRLEVQTGRLLVTTAGLPAREVA